MKHIIIFITALLFATITFAQSNTQETIEQPDTDISRYPIPDVNELPQDIKLQMLQVEESRGFVPNVQYALSYRPELYRAFLELAGVVMSREGNLTIIEKEMIIVATSNRNGCMYCVMAHGAKLRKVSGNPYIADQVAVNYKEADISDRQKAILDFAMIVSQHPADITEEAIKGLEKFGLDKDDALDIANISAFFGLSNRLMNTMKVKPDEENYNLGR
jgi:4-carboxymuconolactone decarboxylase